jgi:glycosyltransferase involved in cell wall biosynthesis
MKVALFVPSLDSGGAQKVFVHLGESLAKQGFDVDLLVVRPEGKFAKDVSSDVNLVVLDARRVATSVPRIWRYLNETEPAVLLSGLEVANIAAILAARFAKAGTAIVPTVHQNLFKSSQESSRFRDRYLPFVSTRFYGSADVVVAVSNGVRGELIERWGLSQDKIKVMYNPVFPERVIWEEAGTIDEQWFDGQDLPVVLGIGRLTGQKRFSDLIDAFARVYERRPCKLIILGEGELRETLQDRIDQYGLTKHAKLPGFVSNPLDYMRKAGVFVLSSGWEALPTVLIEALAAGCPIVSTDCDHGAREILDNGAYGQLVPVGAVEDLADAIYGQLGSSFSAALQKERAELFTFERVGRAYAELVCSLADRSQHS